MTRIQLSPSYVAASEHRSGLSCQGRIAKGTQISAKLLDGPLDGWMVELKAASCRARRAVDTDGLRVCRS